MRTKSASGIIDYSNILEEGLLEKVGFFYGHFIEIEILMKNLDFIIVSIIFRF